LNDPLNVVRAIDDPEVSFAGYDSLIALVGLSAAIDVMAAAIGSSGHGGHASFGSGL
jgi:hypothetical protein